MLAMSCSVRVLVHAHRRSCQTPRRTGMFSALAHAAGVRQLPGHRRGLDPELWRARRHGGPRRDGGCRKATSRGIPPLLLARDVAARPPGVLAFRAPRAMDRQRLAARRSGRHPRPEEGAARVRNWLAPGCGALDEE